MGIDHSAVYYRSLAQERGCGLRDYIVDLHTMMQVLRSPYGEDLSWLCFVFSVFLWLWTIDFTHGVLKGEEICNRCAQESVTPN